MDCSLPGSSVHEIYQERVLEWVAISFSRGSSQPRDQTQIFCNAGSLLLKTLIFFSELFRLYTYSFQIPISLNLSNSTSCKLFLINITLSKLEEDKGRI